MDRARVIAQGKRIQKYIAFTHSTPESAAPRIGSMWSVDDVATQTLMIEFYRNLWEKKLSKGEALRQAQLEMIRGFDRKTGIVRGPVLDGETIKFTAKKKTKDNKTLSPYYWAAFTLSGDWR